MKNQINRQNLIDLFIFLYQKVLDTSIKSYFYKGKVTFLSIFSIIKNSKVKKLSLIFLDQASITIFYELNLKK
jgi:hypothetical protein